MLDADLRMKMIEIENIMNYSEWANKIPAIPMKEGWSIAPMPSFGGAIARFRCTLPDGRVKSIYLDCYDELGFVGEPYWEVYPVGDDALRCYLNEVDKLLKLIDSEGSL